MRIIRAQWLAFAISALVGIALSLVFPIATIARFAKSFLLSQPIERFFGAFLLMIAILIICFSRMSKWWSRYLKTKQLPSPPIIQTDSVLVAVATFMLSCNLFLGISISEAFSSLGTTRSYYVISFCILIITWAVSSLFFSAYVTASHKPTTLPSIDFFDEPITEAKQDILGRAYFAGRLAAQIKSLPLY
jgi:hypothetical protein